MSESAIRRPRGTTDYFGFDNYSTFYREYTKIIGIGKKRKESA